MTVIAVVGSQWGDEAKGKVVDLISQDADIVARFNGGDNAGHTVVNEFGTFKLRLTPNGFSNPKTTCVIGPGAVINLATLSGEIDTIQHSGIDIKERLWVSPRCNVVMPYHPMLETIYEQAKGSTRTGTTKRGMGPVYADKVSYNGIRLFDLADEGQFAEKLHVQLAIKNPIFEAFGIESLDFEDVFRQKLDQFKIVRDMVREPFGILQKALGDQSTILLEGAQGALLDNIWGTYPYCSASVSLAGGAAAGLGIPAHKIRRVIGVAKAYTTRVGGGPMPTELYDREGETLQREGKEYGTVTGRPRRCGWFDAELVRFTAQLNGVTELALSKLDVLDKLPVVKICVGYRRESSGDRLWHYWEGDAAWLGGCEPVYIELEGWQQSTREIRSFERLPSNAKAYVRKVEELVGVPVKLISVGPDRSETIQIS
jgi:adenylosuccinate synthase